MNRFAVWMLALIMIGASPVAAQDLLIEQAVLTLIDQADVPAEEAGQIQALLVREGDVVKAGQPLVQLESRTAELAVKRAELELAVARHLASETGAIDLARNEAERQKQVAAELQIEYAVAEKESENDVQVRAAGKAVDVAGNQHARAQRAREAFKNSIPESELEGLKLSWERAQLEQEQAAFLLSMLKQKLKGKQAGLQSQKLAVETAELEVRSAESGRHLAGLQARLKEHDLEAAMTALKRRSIASPIDGVVVEITRRTGEWVQPGEKVLRVIRVNRLKAEGMIPLAKLPSDLAGQEVLAEIIQPGREPIRRSGTVTFVSPDVDPINQQVRVWVEFDNEKQDLLPGMRAVIQSARASKN